MMRKHIRQNRKELINKPTGFIFVAKIPLWYLPQRDFCILDDYSSEW